MGKYSNKISDFDINLESSCLMDYLPIHQSLKDHHSAKNLLKKTIAILGIILRNSTSKITLALYMYLGFAIGHELLIYYMGLIPQLYGSPIAERNFRMILNITFLSFGMILFTSFISSVQEYIIIYIKAKSRKNLVQYLQKIYLKDSHFYRLNMFGIEYNHDQIITQDTFNISQYFSELISNAFSPFITIFFYTHQCRKSIGALNTMYLFMFFSVFSILAKIAARPLTKTQIKLSKEEGDLRTKYAELREYAEEIAMSNSTGAENYFLNKL